MVRHKRRWLLVRIESSENEDFPSRSELAQKIRDTMLECFGTASVGIADNTKGISQWT